MITVVSVGDRVRRGPCSLRGRFRRSAHFQGPGGPVVLADERIGAGPLTVVLRGGDPASVATLSVAGDAVVVDGRPAPFGAAQVYRSGIGPLPGPGPRWRRGLDALGACLAEEAHPASLAFLLDPGRGAGGGGFARAYARRMREGAMKMDAGDLAGGAATVRGCGFGLTPGGDDFLAGVMIGLNVLQSMDGRSRADRIDAVFGACAADGGFGGACLRLAREGRVDAAMKGLIPALAAGDAEGVRGRARAVLAHGATSGADLATGLLIALRREIETGEADDR